MTTMEELMSAALHADDERKTAALRALRGKDTEAPASRPGPERFLSLTELGAEPRRVRLTPDGRAALVVSDRSKVAWVLR